MKTEDFNKLVDHVIDNLVKKTLVKKGKEYQRGNDRLSNFKRAAAILKCTPEKALIGMWIKHAVSILDLVNDLEGVTESRVNILYLKSLSKKMWDEKIGDAINYLILLRALIEERHTKGD